MDKPMPSPFDFSCFPAIAATDEDDSTMLAPCYHPTEGSCCNNTLPELALTKSADRLRFEQAILRRAAKSREVTMQSFARDNCHPCHPMSNPARNVTDVEKELRAPKRRRKYPTYEERENYVQITMNMNMQIPIQ
jgi:hypothetical protein